jgi:DNA-binding IclR family transcriptional regulator
MTEPYLVACSFDRCYETESAVAVGLPSVVHNMQQQIKSVSAALNLISFFITDRHQWRVTDLAARTGLHKSEVSRILRTFEAYGFIQKYNREYQLGRAFKTYAALVKSDEKLLIHARPIMEKLSAETKGTVLLKIRERRETITIDRVESQHFLRLAYPIGLRLPLNASSSGKIFLAHMSEDERKQLYEGGAFTKFTTRTKTTASALEKDLVRVRRRGYAVSDEEHLLGAMGVAAPIFGAESQLEATLGLGLPKVLLPDKMVEVMATKVRTAAEEISLFLGHKPRNSSDKDKKRISLTER